MPAGGTNGHGHGLPPWTVAIMLFGVLFFVLLGYLLYRLTHRKAEAVTNFDRPAGEEEDDDDDDAVDGVYDGGDSEGHRGKGEWERLYVNQSVIDHMTRVHSKGMNS